MEWRFELNGQALSQLKCAPYSMPAYSGQGQHINQRSSACHATVGPIPPGRYFIVDRPSGGRLSSIRDFIRPEKKFWFGLFADDEQIDDVLVCNQISRGQFRLHPAGQLGISEGCITLPSINDFQLLRSLLHSKPFTKIGRLDLPCYGTVLVV